MAAPMSEASTELATKRKAKPGILKRFGKTFETDARNAIQDNPDYFVRWYTAKSIALVGAIGVAAYYAGKANGIALERGRR